MDAPDGRARSKLRGEATFAEYETGYAHENLEFVLHSLRRSVENAQGTYGALAARDERSQASVKSHLARPVRVYVLEFPDVKPSQHTLR